MIIKVKDVFEYCLVYVWEIININVLFCFVVKFIDFVVRNVDGEV